MRINVRKLPSPKTSHLVLVILVCMVSPLHATITHWLAETGDWSDHDNWSLAEPSPRGTAYVDNGGTVQITQPDERSWYLNVGTGVGEGGTMDIISGDLWEVLELIGVEGSGAIAQAGGTNEVGFTLRLGVEETGIGTYEIDNGEVLVGTAKIAVRGTGFVTQTGGTVAARLHLAIGYYPESTGTYTISGGVLRAGELSIDYVSHDEFAPATGGSDATLNVTNAAAQIIAAGHISFGPGAKFNAVEGTTIRIITSPTSLGHLPWFENFSTDPIALGGVSNLTLIVENDVADRACLVEVAGEDMGPVVEGFQDNFALDALQLGGQSGLGSVLLCDENDNRPGWEGAEALYVGNLILGEGSVLNLDGYNLYYKTLVDNGGEVLLNGGQMVQLSAAVAGRHVFYNNSAFDGDDPAGNGADDNATDPSKSALLPGETATFANYISCVKGINGIMVDVANLHGTPTAEDFSIQVSGVNNGGGLDDYAAGPIPVSVTVRPGAGVDGSDRVTLIFPDTETHNSCWVRVTVFPTPNTGLESPDVFYYGLAIGETGNRESNTFVNGADRLRVRGNPHNFMQPASVESPYDFNKDASVNASDRMIARSHRTNFITCLKLITAP